MNPLFAERSSGVLLHPTSLPGPHGLGDLGPAAHDFLEFLHKAGQRFWQMLPVCPPGGGNSPYDSASAFAGSPLLISLSRLCSDGLLSAEEIAAPGRLRDAPRALYASARRFREKRLRAAFARFQTRPDAQAAQHDFIEKNRHWLDDYALFCALKQRFGPRPWTTWEAPLRRREPGALGAARRELDAEFRYHVFVQYEFDRQWRELRMHAAERGVLLLGDTPMFVAHDAADVWQNQELFQLDENGERRVVAGVPPDYFSADGQRWGNPLYDWNAIRGTGYAWWIERLRSSLQRFDALRLDHFIGFHRYWEIPAHAPSARDGRFVEVPGEDFFATAKSALGGLPFVAEDLGILTPEVERLRDQFELPGMRVIEFAFVDESRHYQPHRFTPNTVVYTGTHDNDTLMGWLTSAERAGDPGGMHRLRAERERALAYAGSDGREAHWDMIRTCLMSVANTAIFPAQDLLGLGTEARMNVPGTPAGNWEWRLAPDLSSSSAAGRMARLCETYERIPPSLRQKR
jgi:4-alpha-glucanotransferase